MRILRRCTTVLAVLALLLIGPAAQAVRVGQGPGPWAVGYQDDYADMIYGGAPADPILGWIDLHGDGDEPWLQIGIDNWNQDFFAQQTGAEHQAPHALFSQGPSGELLAFLADSTDGDILQSTTVPAPKIWFELQLLANGTEPTERDALLTIYGEHTLDEASRMATLRLSDVAMDPGTPPGDDLPGSEDPTAPDYGAVASAPEPATIGLLLVGLGGLGALKSRRRR